MLGVFYINLFSITATESAHHMHLISYPPTSFIYVFRVSQLRLCRAELHLEALNYLFVSAELDQKLVITGRGALCLDSKFFNKLE